MQQAQFTQEQIRNACKSGVELLTDKELRVPGPMAISGALSVLVQILTSVVQGEVVIANPKQVEQTPPDGDGEKTPAPDLTGITGGKQE